MSNVRIHPLAFVPVGSEVVLTGAGAGAGTYTTGSVDVTGVSGIIVQGGSDFSVFSFTQAVSDASDGLILLSDGRTSTFWFNKQTPTLYYAIHNAGVIRYQLIVPAGGSR